MLAHAMSRRIVSCLEKFLERGPTVRVIIPIRPPIVCVSCHEAVHRLCPNGTGALRQLPESTEAECFMIRAIFGGATARLRTGLSFNQTRCVVVRVAAVKGA